MVMEMEMANLFSIIVDTGRGCLGSVSFLDETNKCVQCKYDCDKNGHIYDSTYIEVFDRLNSHG